ncbi:MAG: hypothetical protein HY841_03950 [Bacteroidetes bacterium]|nr:hypothetical protein [Bacteroidota bacterium]
MKKFNYDLTIEASAESEADSKMKSLAVLSSKLSAKELQKLSEVVSNPIKLAIAKQKLGV